MCIPSSTFQCLKEKSDTPSQQQISLAAEPLRILLCSESVPPQVNGIARRIGHYTSGLQELGHKVHLVHPEMGRDKCISFGNPWNVTARMMLILPHYFWEIVYRMNQYDIVHVILPLNIYGIFLLAAMSLARFIQKFHPENNLVATPSLIISWHCNVVDYIDIHLVYPIACLARWLLLSVVCPVLPQISDRILTPTKAADPLVVQLWNDSENPDLNRSGVCYTGIDKTSFSPLNKETKSGKLWQKRKEDYLKETKRKFLILCVGRISYEKGIDQLLECMNTYLKDDCALWLVGGGPAQSEMEAMAKSMGIHVKFWGYQKGKDLFSVYTAADLVVCPSLSETFGQIVNEALASKDRVALPRVPVFTEAYSAYIPNDAFWTPMDQDSMAKAIRTQLVRHAENNPIGIPDLDSIKTWNDACVSLVEEYRTALTHKQQMSIGTLLYLPIWMSVTFVFGVGIFVYSQIRWFVGFEETVQSPIKEVYQNKKQTN